MTNRQWLSNLATLVMACGLVLVMVSFALADGWRAWGLLALGLLLALFGLMGGLAAQDSRRWRK